MMSLRDGLPGLIGHPLETRPVRGVHFTEQPVDDRRRVLIRIFERLLLRRPPAPVGVSSQSRS